MTPFTQGLTQASILVADDTPENLQLLVQVLTEQGYAVHPAPDGEFALDFARTHPPDLILLDIKMSGLDGFQVCERLKADDRTREIPVIFISVLGNIEDKIKGFGAGAVDYIIKPFQPEEVLARVKTHLTLQHLQRSLHSEIRERKQSQQELTRYKEHLEELVEERTTKLQQALTEIQQLQDQLSAENMYLREEIKSDHSFDEIIGQSEVLNYLLFRVTQVAPTDTTVLISGETGTGKELVARAVHAASTRNARTLVKVNCAALPANIIENELFGHEKGAFTGASAKHTGRFELAHGGTIFLDEIGELPLELQPKLLRVLQEGEFERLGSSRTMRIDVRVIAATNRNLKKEVEAGRFRQDLYYRLSVYPLSVPPLRERSEDIPLLVQAFTQKFSKKLRKRITTVSERAMRALQQYDWPGNIRELENVIERAVITSQGGQLRVDLPQVFIEDEMQEKTLQEMQRDYILRILEKTGWKIEGKQGASRILDLHPSTLRSKMHKLHIKRP